MLVVQHTHERSGWVTLPPALCSQLFASGAGSPLALELRRVQHCGSARLPSPDAPPLYAAWGGTSCAAGCVGVPRALARSLGLAEGAEVAVRPLPATPEAESVTVEPAGADDWEVVEANAAYLESSLLSQVGGSAGAGPGGVQGVLQGDGSKEFLRVVGCCFAMG